MRSIARPASAPGRGRGRGRRTGHELRLGRNPGLGLGIGLVSLLLACGACGVPSGPPEPLAVEIVGHEHRWLVRYPGPDGRLGTPDDRVSRDVLRLPAGTTVRLSLASADYDYLFRVPELGVNELAAQVYTGRIELQTGQPAVYAIDGDVLCGWPEPGLESEIRVEPATAFDAFVETLDPWQAPAGSGDPSGA